MGDLFTNSAAMCVTLSNRSVEVGILSAHQLRSSAKQANRHGQAIKERGKFGKLLSLLPFAKVLHQGRETTLLQ